jgi:HAD superfamily hydrolase (TIGR01509 family)
MNESILAIFDHDGVLVDSFDFHQQAWVELGRRTGLPFTPEFVRATFGMANPNILRRLLGDDLERAEIDRLGELKEACYREVARAHLVLMPGVAAALDALAADGFGLAIGSSGPRANLELTIERCGLQGRFSAIAALEDFEHGKPDPEVFLVAARRAGVAPERCVVFEDAVVGIEAARRAGMRCVGIGTTNAVEVLLEAGADHAYETFERLRVVECARGLIGDGARAD